MILRISSIIDSKCESHFAASSCDEFAYFTSVRDGFAINPQELIAFVYDVSEAIVVNGRDDISIEALDFDLLGRIALLIERRVLGRETACTELAILVVQ